MRKKVFVSVCAFIMLAVMIGFTGSTEAVAKEVSWKAQTMWAPSITIWRADKYYCDLVNIMGEGDLKVKFYEGGALVTKSGEMFDSVRNNVVQMGGDWPSYWEGKNTAFSLLTSWPMFFTPADYLLWFWQGGGLELAHDLYGKYGLVWYPVLLTSPECGQRSNKPIKSVADYKNVKMRQCGRIQAKILQDLGGAAIFMPGAEIYMALQRGTIDAGEFSVPECDWSMGFQEVTKYWILPGWHQPGPVGGMMINKKSHDGLSDRGKFVLRESALAAMMWGWTYFEYSSAEYTNKFLAAGTKPSKLDQGALDRIQELSFKYMLDDARANPDYARICFSMLKYMKDFEGWRDMQSPFMFGRNLPGIDPVLAEVESLVKKSGDYDKIIKLEREVRKRMEKQEFWKPGTPFITNPVWQSKDVPFVTMK